MSNVPNLEKYREAAQDMKTAGLLINGSSAQDDGCRVWNRALTTNGYGVVHHHRRALLTHRLAYWIFRGPIEGDLVVDHVCRNRACVEPSHLRLLTREENTALAHTANKSHCVHGHELTDSNVYVFDRKGNPHRQCRTCRIATNERAQQKRYPDRVPRGPRLPHTIAAYAEMDESA